MINLKIYSGFKNKTEKNKKSTSLNHSKKIDNFNSSDNNIKSQYKNNSFQKKKSHFNNSQIFKLKERTQKDIELIDKEISQELLIQKNEKKQQHKKTKSTMHKAQKKISSEKSYEVFFGLIILITIYLGK